MWARVDPWKPGVGVSPRGEPAERGAEQDQQHHRQPEVRHRIEEQRRPHGPQIEAAAAVPAAADPQIDADHRHEDGGGAHEQQGRPQEVQEDVHHGLPLVQERHPEVTVQRVAEVLHELGRQRLVQPEVVDQRGLRLRRQLDALQLREQPDGVARHDPEQEEVEAQDEQQRQEGLQDLPSDVPPTAHGQPFSGAPDARRGTRRPVAGGEPPRPRSPPARRHRRRSTAGWRDRPPVLDAGVPPDPIGRTCITEY